MTEQTMSQPIHINPTLIASPNWSEVSCWTGEKARIMASSLVCIPRFLMQLDLLVTRILVM